MRPFLRAPPPGAKGKMYAMRVFVRPFLPAGISAAFTPHPEHSLPPAVRCPRRFPAAGRNATCGALLRARHLPRAPFCLAAPEEPSWRERGIGRPRATRSPPGPLVPALPAARLLPAAARGRRSVGTGPGSAGGREGAGEGGAGGAAAAAGAERGAAESRGGGGGAGRGAAAAAGRGRRAGGGGPRKLCVATALAAGPSGPSERRAERAGPRAARERLRAAGRAERGAGTRLGTERFPAAPSLRSWLGF